MAKELSYYTQSKVGITEISETQNHYEIHLRLNAKKMNIRIGQSKKDLMLNTVNGTRYLNLCLQNILYHMTELLYQSNITLSTKATAKIGNEIERYLEDKIPITIDL